MSMEQRVLDRGAQLLQSLKPVKQTKQHACTFALYSHDMTRQIETHHFITRLNQDFLQCAVYDSNDAHARLIGIEYIISDSIFETLPTEEQKLCTLMRTRFCNFSSFWIKLGLWVNPGVPEMVMKTEMENLAKTYGKFWCTWQVDRGDKLPLGAPALVMSPQAVSEGIVRPDLIEKRNIKYNVSIEALKASRVEIAEPEWINPLADYWKQHGKGFSVDIEPAEMKKRAPFA
ncbi:hypothetical protein NMG60_11012905 [Bertholletia excelsa]